MAKMRVYELARDLNMTNKELVEKLMSFGYAIGNHMSSIDDDVVAEFKNRLHRKPAKEVEETRVTAGVIRRRKKAAEERKVGPAEVHEVEEEIVEEPQESAQPAEIAETHVPEEVSIEAEPDKIPEPERKPPVEKKPGPKPVIEAEAISEPSAPQPITIEETKAVESALPRIEESVSAPLPVDKIEPSILPEEPLDEATASKKPSEGAPEDVEPLKTEKPDHKKRRTKKDMPAKIIKLGPLPGPLRPAKKEAVEFPTPPTIGPPGAKPTAEAPSGKAIPFPSPKPKTDVAIEAEKLQAKEKDKKKKKGLKKPVEEPVEAAKLPKKKIAFRKKAVVEGEDLYSEENRLKKLRKAEKGKKGPKGLKPQITMPKAIKRRIKVDDTIIISELAKRMGIKSSEIIRKLLGMGVMATVNQSIEFDTAVLVASEFDYEIERASFEEESVLKTVTDDPDKLVPRPPVVTVMGHVDHGKTSLLDAIRKTSVAEHEAGGITQRIGAYHVDTDRGQIVFLDTPGHEAFTAMRSRGASVTDIVILVVAADDGVMPQTVEAINHSKAAGVPIIVAINKIDKPNADIERVQRGLSDVGLMPEEWGGDAIFVKVSAKAGIGIDDLLEMVLLQAELMEIKANPEKLASGHVIEANLDVGRGPVATVLVQDGTLRTGDPVVCGIHYGKIRALVNDRGNQVKSAGPSMPVEIIGLTGVPNAGDEFIALADEKNAKQVSAYRIQKQRSKELAKTNRLSLENLFQQMQEREVKDLNVIIKADVHGSIEALKDSLVKLSNEEVKINVIHCATGAIAESDVSLAAVSDAIIIGFNVRPNPKIQSLATDENVDIRYYDVIYNVINDVQNAIVGMMASTFEEKVLGNAVVREVFHVPKVGMIAGCYVTDGKIQRGQKVRLIRDGIVLYDGKIGSLRRFKDDVKEVLSGFECGIGIENYNDVKIDDMIECYYMEEIKPEL
jgi:translation initiation factor IF-2